MNVLGEELVLRLEDFSYEVSPTSYTIYYLGCAVAGSSSVQLNAPKFTSQQVKASRDMNGVMAKQDIARYVQGDIPAAVRQQLLLVARRPLVAVLFAKIAWPHGDVAVYECEVRVSRPQIRADLTPEEACSTYRVVVDGLLGEGIVLPEGGELTLHYADGRVVSSASDAERPSGGQAAGQVEVRLDYLEGPLDRADMPAILRPARSRTEEVHG